MIEGLWVVKFLTPDDPTMDLNGGVVVVETGRILGGDSGYFYLGNLSSAGNGVWTSSVRVVRHDPEMESVFGDLDVVELSGTLRMAGADHAHRPIVSLEMTDAESGILMTAVMTKVAELP